MNYLWFIILFLFGRGAARSNDERIIGGELGYLGQKSFVNSIDAGYVTHRREKLVIQSIRTSFWRLGKEYYWGERYYSAELDRIMCKVPIGNDQDFRNVVTDDGNRPNEIVYLCKLKEEGPEPAVSYSIEIFSPDAKMGYNWLIGGTQARIFLVKNEVFAVEPQHSSAMRPDGLPAYFATVIQRMGREQFAKTELGQCYVLQHGPSAKQGMVYCTDGTFNVMYH